MNYFSTIHPVYTYNNVPLNGIYVYPFALYPEEYQPSGSVNHSHIISIGSVDQMKPINKLATQKCPEFECPICMEKTSQKHQILCKHSFCPPCIITWSKSKDTCPICRQKLFMGKENDYISKDSDFMTTSTTDSITIPLQY